MSDIRNLPISLRIKNELEEANLENFNSLLMLSCQELSKKANLTIEECEQLKLEVSKALHSVNIVCASSLTTKTEGHLLTTGCDLLDKFLKGGFDCHGITEIAGRSSAGKSQLCMQLALSVQFPVKSGGLDAGAVYICTEDAFPSRRLQELIVSFPSSVEKARNIKFDPDFKYCDNIFIEHIADVESLKQCIGSNVPKLMKHRNIKLLVIDSIAGVFRADFEPGDAINRALELRTVGSTLHKLARRHKIVVICVNQVTEVIGGVKKKTVPALGLAWANLVTTRLMLARSNLSRSMTLLFSPSKKHSNQSTQKVSSTRD